MTLAFTLKHLPINRFSIKTLSLLIFLTLPSITSANSLTKATNTLCSKIKSCTTAQLTQQQLPPAMMEMMTSILDKTCAQTIAPYAELATNAGLEKSAIACLHSLNTLSCDALMNTKEAETSECKALEKAANEAGIDTGT